MKIEYQVMGVIRRLGWVALFVLCVSATAQAESPNAGQLLQQIEKDRGTALPQKPLPEVIPIQAPQAPVTGATITVTAFKFVGNTLIDSKVLAKTVAGYTNRPIGFAELQNAAVAVAEAYREAGWVVRSFLPKQDIENGIVTIQIVEAIFGGIRFEGEEQSHRLELARATAMIDAVQGKGKAISVKKLERGLLLLNDLPGVIATATLQPGEAEKETVLALKLSDEPFFSGNVGIDNTGPRYTGSERITANFYLNSPGKRGDQAIANLIHSQGIDYARLAYSLPWGYQGWRINGTAAVLNYKLVADEFKSLKGEGSSTSLGLDASRPLIRSNFRNLYVGFNFDHKRLDNQANHVTSSRYNLNKLSVSLNGNLFDKQGKSINSAGLTLSRGDVDLGSLDFGETAELSGNFNKLNYYVSRQQVVTDSISAFATLSGQAASSKLDSSEKFSLGGSTGVRAYPASEGEGSSGQLLALELRKRLPNGYSASGFIDVGHISDSSSGPSSYTLKGAGLALAWQAQFGLNVKATWAHRIGDNPNPTIAGNDQDGSLHKNRFWLQAIMPF